MPPTLAAVACLAVLELAGCGGLSRSASPTPATLSPARPVATQPSPVRNVHDPAVIKVGTLYWLYSTGPGIPIRRSTDLVHWRTVGRVFVQALPAGADALVPGVRFPWAPDVSFYHERFHLYYALSTFASQRSAIALATNATLDPTQPGYGWTDGGVVVTSDTGDSFNAIDPTVALDERGEPWLAWGSFWGGIKLHRLNAATGRLATADTTTYSLASRVGPFVTSGPTDAEAIEAPSIVAHGGHFYLFASYDLCCRGAASTYNTRVGRSVAITGPYVDRTGRALTAGGGTVVLAGAGRVSGPGGGSVLVDGDRAYLVHHFYDTQANGTPTLQVRPITWSAEGWPVVGDPLDSRSAP